MIYQTDMIESEQQQKQLIFIYEGMSFRLLS